MTFLLILFNFYSYFLIYSSFLCLWLKQLTHIKISVSTVTHGAKNTKSHKSNSQKTSKLSKPSKSFRSKSRTRVRYDLCNHDCYHHQLSLFLSFSYSLLLTIASMIIMIVHILISVKTSFQLFPVCSDSVSQPGERDDQQEKRRKGWRTNSKIIFPLFLQVVDHNTVHISGSNP